MLQEGASTMSTTTHTRSIHVDAPVAKVFDHVKDPHHYTVMGEFHGSRLTGHMKAEFTDVTMTADGGLGSTWSFTGTLFGFHQDATFTRDEYVPNERIVDRNADAGTAWTFTVEPDETGTTLGMGFAISSRVPLLAKAEDVVSWDVDRDLDTMLTLFKKAIET
jgi:hypothetical protein